MLAWRSTTSTCFPNFIVSLLFHSHDAGDAQARQEEEGLKIACDAPWRQTPQKMSPITTARHGQAAVTSSSHHHESKPLLPPASSPVGELSSSLSSSSSPFIPPFSGSKSSKSSGCHATITATTAASSSSSSSSSSSNLRSSAYGASSSLPPCNSPSSPSPRFRDWLRPTKATATASALLDVWVPWLAYLGLGVGANDFVLGGIVAAGVAMLGFLFQGYRFHGQRSLRTWPKVHGMGVFLTWMANAVFVAGVASDGKIATVSLWTR